jgi:uncharacterized protein (DUF486 family)
MTLPYLAPIVLLLVSNVFMTFAWYGQLKYPGATLWVVIPISWGIAFFEYCLAVPANRIGAEHYSKFQLKITQEVITLIVFTIYSCWFLREWPKWNHIVSFALILGAWLAFFLPRFHPWKHDDRNLIAMAESDYEAARLPVGAAA